MLLYPLNEAAEVLAYFRDYVAVALDEVGILGNLRSAPPLHVVPPELHGKPVDAIVVYYWGDVKEGENSFSISRRERCAGFIYRFCSLPLDVFDSCLKRPHAELSRNG